MIIKDSSRTLGLPIVDYIKLVVTIILQFVTILENKQSIYQISKMLLGRFSWIKTVAVHS